MAGERVDRAPPCRLLLLLLHFCRGQTDGKSQRTTNFYFIQNQLNDDAVSAICLKQPKEYCFEVTNFSVFEEVPLQVTLGHALPRAGSAQAGRAGPAREDRCGGGRGRLAGTVVLEQNIHAASAG